MLDACDRVVFLSHDGTSISASHHELADTVVEYRDLVDPHRDQRATFARRATNVGHVLPGSAE